MNQTNALPRLETERLLLRPLAPDDADFVFRHFSDPAVTRYLADMDPLTQCAQAEEIVRSYLHPADDSYGCWVITWKADGAPIGLCNYDRYDARSRRFEVGYSLSPACWGQGIMTEALRAVLRYGFTQMNLNRVEALVALENIGSIRVLEKLGFQREGLFRDFFCRQGLFYDFAFYALLRREWDG